MNPRCSSNALHEDQACPGNSTWCPQAAHGTFQVMATIGHEFDFSVFTRRWGHFEKYVLTLTEKGWHVAYSGMEGDSDAAAYPTLYANFRQDFVAYPEAIKGAIAWIHREHPGFTDDEVQDGLARLAGWVSELERTTPQGGIFHGYW